MSSSTVNEQRQCQVSSQPFLTLLTHNNASYIARKRQRLSSPTYDEQVDLSQEDIDAFDKIQQRLSQSQSPTKSDQPIYPSTLVSKETRALGITVADKENGSGHSASPSKDLPAVRPAFEHDTENPFNVSTNKSSLSAFLFVSFTSG